MFTTKVLTEYFIIGLPYFMAAVFLIGSFFRLMMWYTVKRHEWFARQFELRVNRFIAAEIPGERNDASFYVLSKRLLERTFYETFAVRDRLKRRRGDGLIERSMDAACFRILERRQRVDVGGLQFAQTAAGENMSRQFVLRGQLRQGVFIR